MIPQQIDWNAVEAIGTWFAGLATAGSLWLDFLLLRGDRPRRMAEQASKVACWAEILEGFTQDDGVFCNRLKVYIWNRSGKPLFYAEVCETR